MSVMLSLSEIVKYYTPEFRELLNELGEIAKTMNIVEMVTPLNAAEERKKWLEQAENGAYTNPQFQYNGRLLAEIANKESALQELTQKMGKMTKQLSAEDPGRVLTELAWRRRDELEATIWLAQCMLQGDDSNADAALVLIYGAPEDLTVAAAHDYAKAMASGKAYRQRDTPQLKTVREKLQKVFCDAKRVQEEFIWVAEQSGIAQTRPVEIDPIATAVDVRDKSSRGPIVVIPAGYEAYGVTLVRLCAHEILCHWADSERAARALPLLGGGALKPADETLYEGHATWAGNATGMMLGEKTQRQRLPFYIIAMSLARKGMNFADVATALYEIIRPTEATDKAALELTWKTCMRVFRGSHGNQDNALAHYAFTKDRAYFEGHLVAERLHDQGFDSILDVATLSLGDIELLKTVVQFERRTDSFVRMGSILQEQVSRLIDEEFVL